MIFWGVWVWAVVSSFAHGREFTIAEIEKELESQKGETALHKAAVFSGIFLGQPYQSSPLGEGKEGEFDRDPLYRFDAFDCTTYVETVMALAHAQNLPDFEENMNRIRYQGNKISFETRNHFPELDWVPELLRQNLIRDLTVGSFPLEFIAYGQTEIDKRNWFAHLPASRLQGFSPRVENETLLLERLHHLGDGFLPEKVQAAYVKTEALLSALAVQDEGRDLFLDFPEVMLINVIRPGWDLRSVIGTAIHVSHQGLLLKQNGTYVLRHASSVKGADGQSMVREENFKEYLKKFVNHPTVRGFQFYSF